jgi:pimeloyl-ACP methyl ester carboxylesterase
VDRVVGDVNADGTLVSPQELISNGVVSQFATLSMPAFDIDIDAVLDPPDQPERDRVLLNGNDIGPSGSAAFLTGTNNVWKMNTFQIPIEMIRFGKRDSAGGPPAPGMNLVEVQIDVANASTNTELWCMSLDWGQISFEALAPVIMVHGNNSSSTFWEGIVVSPESPSFNMRTGMDNHPGRGETYKFIQPFVDHKIPFDNSINMATHTIANHGDLLRDLIPFIAEQFGARHVHLVAHSKGGLDVRDFLARTIPPNLGVLSMTTLSTPHRGSPGPDYQIDSQTANSLYSDDSTRTKLGQLSPPDKVGGTWNLRVSFVAAFNASNLPLLPKQFTVDGVTNPVVYRCISADANLDDSTTPGFGNPSIQFNETFGIPGQGSKPDTAWAYAVEQVYRLIGNVAFTTLETGVSAAGGLTTVNAVRETPTSSFQLNDFAVTLTSACIDPFERLASVKDNHSTISNPTNGQIVLNWIRTVQPVK